jgi:hypothetical protein
MGICGSLFWQARTSVAVLDACGPLRVSTVILQRKPSLTWSAYMANSYPEEKDKGKWRAIQWAGNLGGSTVGSCIALG